MARGCEAADQIADGSVDNASNTSVITYTGADKLHLGDVLTAGVTPSTPDGLLGIVTGLQPTASGTQVSMRAGSLQDALPNADIESGDLDATSGDAPPDNSPALPPESPPGGTPEFAPNAMHPFAAPNAAASGALPSSARLDCSAGVSAALTTSLKLASRINLEGSWRWGQGTTVNFGYSGGLYGSVSLNLDAAATCTASRYLPGPTLPRITFTIGPVPVVITPQLSMRASITGTVGGAFKASAGVQATLDTGARYDHGSWTPYFTPAAGFPVTVGAHAGATISAQVIPRLDLKVYGVAGPYAQIGATATGHVGFMENPWWYANASLGGSVGVSLDVWLIHAQFDAGYRELREWKAGQAPGPYPGPAVSTTTLPDASVGTPYSAQLVASGAGPNLLVPRQRFTTAWAESDPWR